MLSPTTPDIRAGDLVAVTLPPGQDWAGIVRKVWEAGGALFPVDHRLPASLARDLMERAVPTIVVDADGWHRAGSGRPIGDGVALVVHTSGTGGVPKLVQFDRPAIDAAVASSTLALEVSPHDRWLCCLPLAHVGGLLVLLRSVLLGAPITVHPRFDAAAVAAEADAAFVSLVPTMLIRLRDADADLSHFRAILVGGAALPAWLADRARAEGSNVIETYGLTESCGGVVYDGRPLPGTEVSIDGDGGIQLRGPTLMRGYLDDAEATARAFTEGGWLRAGDAGWIDDQGRLRVVGRLDDLINTGGEKVWPAEVEAARRGRDRRSARPRVGSARGGVRGPRGPDRPPVPGGAPGSRGPIPPPSHGSSPPRPGPGRIAPHRFREGPAGRTDLSPKGKLGE